MSKGKLIKAQSLKLSYDYLIRKDDHFDYEWVIYYELQNSKENGYEHNVELWIILL